MKQGLTNWTCNRHRRKILMRVNQRGSSDEGRQPASKCPKRQHRHQKSGARSNKLDLQPPQTVDANEGEPESDCDSREIK